MNWKKPPARFALALKLNPDNIVAQINLQFNHSLRAGKSVPVDPSLAAVINLANITIGTK